jgi:hypothetical protein
MNTRCETPRPPLRGESRACWCWWTDPPLAAPLALCVGSTDSLSPPGRRIEPSCTASAASALGGGGAVQIRQADGDTIIQAAKRKFSHPAADAASDETRVSPEVRFCRYTGFALP